MSMDHSDRLATLSNVIAALGFSVAIFDSHTFSWEVKYDMIFTTHAKTVRPGLRELGLRIEWLDLDTTYQEDVSAYMTSARDMLDQLITIQEAINPPL